MNDPRDPYAPPRDEPVVWRHDLPRWTVGSVLVAAWRQYTARAGMVLIALGVIPALWQLPATLLYERGSTLGADALHSELAGNALVDCVVAAWGALISAGVLMIALAVARGQPVDLRSYVRGLRLWPAMFAIELAVPLVSDLTLGASLAMDDRFDEMAGVLLALGGFALGFGALYVAFRWGLAGYGVVERHGLFASLGWSWRETGRHQLQYFVFILVVSMVYVPGVVLNLLAGALIGAAAQALVAPFVSLAIAHVALASNLAPADAPALDPRLA